jgi:uncharacterized protein (TIGR00369 family)
MTEALDHLAQIREINALAPFNLWAGIEVAEASSGRVTLTLPWRKELGQYSSFLHAGVIGALIDTACGFAAVTVVGGVLASHYSVNCFSPAIGSSFKVEGHVSRAGRKQVFATANLYAISEAETKLVANGSAILVPVA